VKGAILCQVVPVSTPFLLGLVIGVGALAVWYFRGRAARDSVRDQAARKTRNAAMKSAQNVEAAIRGRR
jgi:hypothetical protein